jgi:hypothetical protein
MHEPPVIITVRCKHNWPVAIAIQMDQFHTNMRRVCAVYATQKMR